MTLLSANIEVNGLLKKENKESSKCQRANRKQQLIKWECVVSKRAHVFASGTAQKLGRRTSYLGLTQVLVRSTS